MIRLDYSDGPHVWPPPPSDAATFWRGLAVTLVVSAVVWDWLIAWFVAL